MADFQSGWFTPQKCFIELILKVAVKFKTTFFWMESRLLLLGSELPTTPILPLLPPPTISFYPPKTPPSSTPRPLTSIFPLPSPSFPQPSVKIANICLRERERSHNISGSRASIWDTVGASLGLVTLVTPTARYFTFTSTWHRAHIAWGSLLSVSSPHPSSPFLLCTDPSLPLAIHFHLKPPPVGPRAVQSPHYRKTPRPQFDSTWFSFESVDLISS